MTRHDGTAVRLVAAGANYISLELGGTGTPISDEELAVFDELPWSAPGLNLLLDLKAFKGWDPFAVAQEVWRRAGADSSVSKLAIVCGEDLIQELLVQVARPLLSDRIRVFGTQTKAAAIAWLSTPSLTTGLPRGRAHRSSFT